MKIVRWWFHVVDREEREKECTWASYLKLKSRGTSILKKGQIPGFPSLNKEISQVLRESRLGQSPSVQNEGQLLWWVLALSKWQFGVPTVPLSLDTKDKYSRMEGLSRKSCLLLRLRLSCGRLQASLCISSSRMGQKSSKLKKKCRQICIHTHTHIYTWSK